MSWLRTTSLSVLFSLCASLAMAVQPDEILDDPALEARARSISAELRCLVCRNESIDESNAELARDLRLLVRERLLAGDNDGQVIDFVVARYGEYVLLRPQTGGSNLLLWLAGPGMALVAFFMAALYFRDRRRQGLSTPDTALSQEEQERLNEILKE